MTIKIDLEKAYQRMRREFIKDTSIDVGLPNSFANMVWFCISTLSIKVLWNGEVLDDSFRPTRGICQGDPLSHYLFVFCMKRLSQLIVVAVENTFWKPIRLSRRGLKLSHLAFANNLVFFFLKHPSTKLRSLNLVLIFFVRALVPRLFVRKLIFSLIM